MGSSWITAISEILGSFFFISTILIVTSKNAEGFGVLAAYIIGLALTVSIYFGGKASLGSFNPAVSIALLLRGDLDIYTTILYIISETVGAVLAYAWWHATLGAVPI